jgi:hypothetical protein
MELLFDSGRKKKINNIYHHSQRKKQKRKNLNPRNLQRKRNQNNI